MAALRKFLRLRCAVCGVISERGLDANQLSVYRGEFVPVECPHCGSRTAEPTVWPWELTFNDRKLLRSMRIRQD